METLFVVDFPCKSQQMLTRTPISIKEVKKCNRGRNWDTERSHIEVCFTVWVNVRAEILMCMLIYLTVTNCVLSSHLTPSILALTRRRVERLGQGQSRPFRLCSTVSSFGQSKQTGLAPGRGGLSRVALPGQGIVWDRTGWDGRPLIDAAHYFHPRKLGQL